MTTVAHPLIVPGAVARRDYQVAIAHEALQRNTLVILPTGMGKTVVALLVLADRLRSRPGKVLFLAPTKPLVEQHARFLRDVFTGGDVAVFTGETPPEERELEWRTATIVCSTPQVVQNDVVAGRFDLKDVTLLLFDEAHRATGNYAYVFLADAYRRQRFDGRVLGMTASPGSKPEKVRDICLNLGIEGVEVRTESDPDTRAYVQDTDVEWKQVSVPESIKRIAETFTAMFNEKVDVLKRAQALPTHAKYASKKALLDAHRILQARLKSGEQESIVFQALSAQAAALKLGHASELIETQGVRALESYLERLSGDESKAAKAILADPRIGEVRKLVEDSRVEHPKLRQVAILLRQQLAKKADSRVIVFTNYRDTAETLVQALAGVEGVRPARFVGQASRSETDKGLSQKKQVQMVEDFKAGTYNVLVATSVAEEGLDIPATDLVIFYEPVASEIRTIQRRGRTGRRRAGRVVVLITKDTRDETYHWAARGKEQRMAKEIKALKQYFGKVNASTESDEWRKAFESAALPEARPEAETTLDAFAPMPDPAQRVVIVADHREFASAVVRELSKLGAVVKPETLATGDYVLSDRVAVERKEADDFAASLIDGRLFPQARALRDAYTSPLLVVEGEGLLTARRIHEDAIWGALASLSSDLRCTTITTKDAAETARLLFAIAKREQLGEKRALAVRGAKGAMTDDERLRYILEGLPHVSAVLARRLLEHFGTVRDVANASLEDLMRVEGIGPTIATDIHTAVRTIYTRRGTK